jgi:hypothetical protein
LRVWLEREIQDGVWQPEATLFDHRVPAASDVRYDLVFDGCISGRWRVRAQIRGGITVDGKESDFDLPTDERITTRRINCPGPR